VAGEKSVLLNRVNRETYILVLLGGSELINYS